MILKFAGACPVAAAAACPATGESVVVSAKETNRMEKNIHFSVCVCILKSSTVASCTADPKLLKKKKLAYVLN